MASVTGSLTLRRGEFFYSLMFAENGWMAADMVQYLSDIYAAEEAEAAILKLLGYTMEVAGEAPPRTSSHWVEVDLEGRLLETNSQLIRKAVHGEPAADQDPFLEFTLRRVHAVLNRYDFTVRLVKSGS